MKKDKDIEKLHNGIKALIYKLPIVLLVSAMVILGIFSIFAQFDTDYVPEYYIAHKTDMGFSYYEWDNEGNRHELEAVYNQYGYWETVHGSDFMDDARSIFGLDLEDGNNISDDEIPVGKLPIENASLIASLSTVINTDVIFDNDEISDYDLVIVF